MSEAYYIELNYRQAINQARQLEKVAKNLLSMSDEEMVSIINETAKNWQGINAEQYIKKCKKIENQISKVSSEISRTATTIRTMAKNIYDSEMRALELAREREYNAGNKIR